MQASGTLRWLAWFFAAGTRDSSLCLRATSAARTRHSEWQPHVRLWGALCMRFFVSAKMLMKALQ